MNTPTGMLAKKDAIQYKTDTGVSVGIALGYARDAAFNHYALLTPLLLQAGLWQPIAGAITVVPAGAIMGAVPYFHQGQGMCILLHATS